MYHFKKLQGLILLVGIFMMAVAVGAVNALDKPKGQVILTVSGKISNTNQGDQAVFDAGMLKAIGETAIRTSTSWTKGAPEFTGVMARDLLKAVGASGGTVLAVALNDYKKDIPVSDFEQFDVVLATRMNGKTLSRRDKGPIWIVYPRDAHAELQNPTTDEKFVWQVVRLIVE